MLDNLLLSCDGQCLRCAQISLVIDKKTKFSSMIISTAKHGHGK